MAHLYRDRERTLQLARDMEGALARYLGMEDASFPTVEWPNLALELAKLVDLVKPRYGSSWVEGDQTRILDQVAAFNRALAQTSEL